MSLHNFTKFLIKFLNFFNGSLNLFIFQLNPAYDCGYKKLTTGTLIKDE